MLSLFILISERDKPQFAYLSDCWHLALILQSLGTIWLRTSGWVSCTCSQMQIQATFFFVRKYMKYIKVACFSQLWLITTQYPSKILALETACQRFWKKKTYLEPGFDAQYIRMQDVVLVCTFYHEGINPELSKCVTNVCGQLLAYLGFDCKRGFISFW